MGSDSRVKRVTSSSKLASEKSLLAFSLAMGVFFAVLGVGWGLAIQSGVILFDGIYSGMSIILTMLSIVAMQLLKQPDDDTFQFGRMAFEPLVVAFKSLVIIAVCLYGIVTSAIAIQHGGEDNTDALGGIIYGAVSISACLFSWYYLKSRGDGMPDLVQAESEQWLMDTVLSAAVMASFIASYLVANTGWAHLVPYIDPAMVVLGSCFFIRMPAARFVASVRELLLAAPDNEIQQQLADQVDEVVRARGFADAVVRSSKVGRELAVDIAFIGRAGSGPVELEELDRIRSEMEQRLSPLGFKLWMNILFTLDRRWA
jgi:predicted Co/Zn/Cd cation transporter (cation efflux family)